MKHLKNPAQFIATLIALFMILYGGWTVISWDAGLPLGTSPGTFSADGIVLNYDWLYAMFFGGGYVLAGFIALRGIWGKVVTHHWDPLSDRWFEADNY